MKHIIYIKIALFFNKISIYLFNRYNDYKYNIFKQSPKLFMNEFKKQIKSGAQGKYSSKVLEDAAKFLDKKIN